MITKIINAVQIPYTKIVKHTRSGNIHEVMAYDHKSTGSGIVKLSQHAYYDSRTPFLNPAGEVLLSVDDYTTFKKSYPEFNPCNDLYTDSSGYSFLIKAYHHTENRSQSPNEIRRTFKKLRALINSNCSDPRKCKFITLTYKENMTDPVRLRSDLSAFIKRFKRFVSSLVNSKGENLGLSFEYIAVLEPQDRGAWHAHIIFIFNKQIRFIKNDDVSRIWSHGFTTTRRVDNVDNIGSYLTAYLADIPVSDSISSELVQTVSSESSCITVKECVVPSYDSSGCPTGKEKKKFIKGGRLHLYPKGFHLFRCSKGVKRPTVEYKLYQDVLNEIGLDASLTFHKSIYISDGGFFENTLTYLFYNTSRKSKREDARTSGKEILRCCNDFVQNRSYAPEQIFAFSDSGVDLADKNTSDILSYLNHYDSMRC